MGRFYLQRLPGAVFLLRAHGFPCGRLTSAAVDIRRPSIVARRGLVRRSVRRSCSRVTPNATELGALGCCGAVPPRAGSTGRCRARRVESGDALTRWRVPPVGPQPSCCGWSRCTTAAPSAAAVQPSIGPARACCRRTRRPCGSAAAEQVAEARGQPAVRLTPRCSRHSASMVFLSR